MTLTAPTISDFVTEPAAYTFTPPNLLTFKRNGTGRVAHKLTPDEALLVSSVLSLTARVKELREIVELSQQRL